MLVNFLIEIKNTIYDCDVGVWCRARAPAVEEPEHTATAGGLSFVASGQTQVGKLDGRNRRYFSGVKLT